MCLKKLQSDVLIIDNDAEPEIKKLIEPYTKIINPRNIYVNPAWNMGMEYFLKGSWDFLCIMNSDISMIWNWEEFCLSYFDGSWMLPTQVTGAEMPDRIDMRDHYKVIKEGFPGIFMFMDREMVKKAYPIPKGLKLWFGDNWIFNRTKREQRVYYNLKCEHGNSRSVCKLEDFTDIIEQDKIEWSKLQSY